MSATRTQVYFTADQRQRLDERARREGTTMASVVRAAVDAYLREDARPDLAAVLAESFGTMPDIEAPPRAEWDRGDG